MLKECIKYNNFSSAFAIIAALSVGLVSKQKAAWLVIIFVNLGAIRKKTRRMGSYPKTG
jgi:hypothetical protein